MLISYKRLPARIQPSLYNQTRTIGGKSVIITRTEKEVVKMNMNPIREDCRGNRPCLTLVVVLQSINALDYCESQVGRIHVILSKSCISIDENGETHFFLPILTYRTSVPLSVDANRCSLYPLFTQPSQSENDALLIVFGDLTILSFLIRDKRVISVDPISLPFRCSLIDVSGTTLCSPLADGTVMLWELEDRHWRSIGVFALSTLRITGVSIACFPTIVLSSSSPPLSSLGTWEGNVVVEEWSTATTSAQRLLSLPHHKTDLSAGGAFPSLPCP